MQLQDEFHREERRSILLAGLSLVLLVLIFSPFGQAIIPSLALLTPFWVIYVLGMLVYFSDDLFQPSTRKAAKAIALTCLFVYPFAVFLQLLATAATIYLPAYAFVMNWVMVIIGTTYAILIGGRVYRFHLTSPSIQKAKETETPLDEINHVFEKAAKKASRTRQALQSTIEKFPKPSLQPLGPILATAATPSSSEPTDAYSSEPKKPKMEDTTPLKKPLGTAIPRKARRSAETNLQSQSKEDQLSSSSS